MTADGEVEVEVIVGAEVEVVDEEEIQCEEVPLTAGVPPFL